MANGQDTGAHSGRQGGRDSHATRKAGKLAPSGDMGTPEINTKVKEANPMPAGGTAPEGTTKIYQTPASLQGYGLFLMKVCLGLKIIIKTLEEVLTTQVKTQKIKQ
jgi:hypothetical protein